MSDEAQEPKQEVIAEGAPPSPPGRPPNREVSRLGATGEPGGADNPAPETPGSRQVPIAEAIKHRRRAQQAEGQLRQVEQKLQETQTQLEQRLEQLASAEAQRDELQHQLEQANLRASAERMLLAAGVADVETAMTLLEKRTGFSEDLDAARLGQAIERLVQDKPFLVSPVSGLPGKTASARLPSGGPASRLAQAATRAAQTGTRRAVSDYLRLRRQTQMNP